MTQLFRAGLLALFALASLSVRAEIAYVSEGVNVGVHREATLTSTILTLVPESTPLEVLQNKGGLVKVRLSDGVEGWVDGRYLTKNISPGKKTAGLEAELLQTATELAQAREVAAELEFQLNRERERAKIIEADLLKVREELENKPSNDGSSTTDSAEALRKLRQATEENARLKNRIDDLETKLVADDSDSGETKVVIIERNPAANDDASLLSRYTAITEWQFWQVMLLFFGLLLAFAIGAYVVDWEVRRRHGGFRV